MNTKVEEFKRRLQRTQLLCHCNTKNDNQMMIAVLNNVEFGRQWMRVRESLEKISPNWMDELFINGELKEIFDLIDEKASYAIPSNASVQGDIMDDLILVAQAARVDYQDDWLDKIWAEYQQGKFPHFSDASKP